MHRRLGTTVVLLLGLSAPGASGGSDKPATPAEQYKALLKEQKDLPEDISNAKTADERKKALARLATLPQRFLDLAKKHPTDAVAVDALARVVEIVNGTAFPSGGKDSPGARALVILLRDHVRSGKLGPVCLRLSFGFRKDYDSFLRAVLKKSPHRDVRGLACLALGHFLNNRLQRLELTKDRPDQVKRYEGLFGKDYLQELRRQGHARLAREAEAVFEQALEKYSDVKVPDGMANFGFAERSPAGKATVGRLAKALLFELRDLAVGQKAPDIEGDDQDGKRFKLSDYRGKVVLLDFWHQH